jgi:uncharacterized DUF497 family protein
MFTVQLIWDAANIAHIARHAVTKDEVEQVCANRRITSQTYTGRIRVIGETSDRRLLTVILAPKVDDLYYPVTARLASRKERALYGLQKGGEQAA